MNSLRFRCELGDDWYDAWIEVSVTTPQFRGTTGFYGCPEELGKFADELAAFPVDPAAPPEFKSLSVSFRVEPMDAVGNLWLRVSLQEFFDRRDGLNVAIPATYGGLQNLQRALKQFVEWPQEEVSLDIY